MTSARLEPAKGVEDLVIAIGLLTRRGIDVELQLVGSGPMRSRLEYVAARMGIGERISFLSVPWVEMPDAYRDADVFVLASAPAQTWREQFGFALIEALATGLPALVGASGALREVAGRDDVLVQPHDPLDLARMLEPLLTDESCRHELGEWNRRFALERYDQRNVRERLLGVYGEVLARDPRP
jgi:glycosyltransferase involved in cell wall biosynthesis